MVATTTGLRIDSLTPALAELERAMCWASEDLEGMDIDVTPTIQTRGRKKRCLGHFAPKCWSTREGDLRAEISFSAETLNRDPIEIIGVALHELVHAWNYSRGIKDASKSDRHNRRFKAAAEDIGLVVKDPEDSYGHGYTSVGDPLRKRIEKDFVPDYSALNLFRLDRPAKNGTSKQRSWVCDCGYKVRTAINTVMDAQCQVCGAEYVEA